LFLSKVISASMMMPRALSFLRFTGWTLIVLIILVSNTLRFYKLGDVPDGYHVDELSASVCVQCLATEGVDAHLQPYPFFSDVNYGNPKPPTYLYPCMMWSKIFGFSEASFRAFSAFVFTITLVGIFFLGRLWGGIALGTIALL